jgi:cell division protein FtsN
MSRDYKPSTNNTKKSSGGSPLLTGLLIGILVGIGLALLVIMFLKSGDSPFNENEAIPRQNPNKYDDLAKPADADNDKPAVEDKTRFDFYTILPGKEKQLTSEEINAPKESAAVTKNIYYLQVGAFQTTDEADNMKAKLALQGFETVVQTASIPNKGVWHRVRVGPMSDLDTINNSKTELAQAGFNADLIKMDSSAQ